MAKEQIAELLVTLGLDSTRFDSAMANINKQTYQMEKAFNGAKKALDLSKKSQEDYSKAIKAGEEAIESTKTKLESLKDQYVQNENKLADYAKELRELPAKIAQSEAKLEELKETVGEGSEEYKKAEAELKRYTQQHKNADKGIENTTNKMINLSNGMQNAENRIKELTNEVEDLNDSMKSINADKLIDIGDKIQNAGGKIKGIGYKLSGLSTALAGVFTGAGALSYGLDQGLSKVGSLVDKNLGQMNEYRDEIIDVSNETGASVGGLTEAWYQAISAGVDFGDSLDFLEVSAKLAKGGFTDTASAVDILATTMNIYGDKAGDALTISDKLLTVQNKGVTTVAELSSAMGGALSVGGAYSVSFDNVATAFAKVTAQGRSTSEASTQITRVMQELADAGGNVGKIIKDKTGKSFQGLMEEGYSLYDALKVVAESAEESGLSVDQLFSSSEAGMGALAILSEEGFQFNDTLKEIEGSTGVTQKAFEGMNESAGAKLANTINELKNTFLELGDKLAPTVEMIADKVSDLINWFAGLDEGTKDVIVKAGLFLIVLAPLVKTIGSITSVCGGAVKGIGGLAKKFITAGGSGGVGALSGALGTLSAVAIPVAIGALVGIMATVGDNEQALYKLQEKWGTIGTVISGVCEFVSGVVQMNFGLMLNTIMLIVDVIAALIDGKGGKTVSDAWERFGARNELTINEGMNKIFLTSTRGMSQLIEMTDEQLLLLNTSFETIMGQVPLIAEGNYQEASTAILNSLTGLNEQQWMALVGMNDTTEAMFMGIRNGMTIEEASNKVVSNLQTMASSGKFDVETMEKDLSTAMNNIKSNMDVQTAEGAGAVETNMANAQNAINSATGTMATDAGTGMAGVAGAMVDESGKIPKEIESNLKTSVNTINTSMDEMKNKTTTAMTEMANESNTKLDEIIKKCEELVKAFSNADSRIGTHINSIANKVGNAKRSIVSDWNSVISTINRSVTGSVTINRTIKNKEVDVRAGLAPMMDASMANMQLMTRDIAYAGRMYQPTPVASTSSVKADKVNTDMINELKNQNGLLMQMVTILTSGQTINLENSIQISGREVAKQSAKFMNGEINTINKRSNRLAGYAY